MKEAKLEGARGGWSLWLVLALVAATYWSGLGNGFVWLDQSEILEGAIAIDDWSEVPALFTNDRNNPGYHRPIYTLAHSLDKALWGTQPFGFLLSSLCLHLLNVALVFAILRRLKGSTLLATLVALGWGLHPVNSAVVGLIHSKADLLFVFGGLGSFWLFLLATSGGPVESEAPPRRMRRALAWVLSGVAFALALLSKENALLFALLVTVLSSWPGLWLGVELSARRKITLRRNAAMAWGLTLLVVALRLGSAAPDAYPSELSRSERLLTFAGVYVGYLQKLVLPLRLSIADTVTAFSALETGAQVQSLAALTTALALQVWAAIRWPWLRVWVFLFNLSLVPVSQFVPILHFRADRFLYLPSLAFVGAVVEGLVRAVQKRGASAQLKVTFASLIMLWVAFASVRIHLRLRDFRNDETLFRAELAHTPDYLEGLSVLGRTYDRVGEHELAGELLRRSLEEHPGRISYLDRGGAVLAYSYNLLARGRVDEAIEFLKSKRGVEFKPVHREELDYNLSVAEFRSGDAEAALPGFEQYHAKHPDDPSCLYFLGRSAMRLGKSERARSALTDYLRLAPDAPDRAEVEGWLRDLDD